MLGGNRGTSEIVSWTGSFTARRQLFVVNLRRSYAAEVKVLTSLDGKFEEAAWMTWAPDISGHEPSFEETIMLAAAAKSSESSDARGQALGLLWMLREPCAPPVLFHGRYDASQAVSLGHSLVAEPFLDAIVAGDLPASTLAVRCLGGLFQCLLQNQRCNSEWSMWPSLAKLSAPRKKR